MKSINQQKIEHKSIQNKEEKVITKQDTIPSENKPFIIRKTMRLLFKNIGLLFLCEVLFTTAMVLTITPVFSYIFEVALKSSDFSYLKLENIFAFLMKPVTLLCIFSLVTISAMVLLYNMSLLLTFFSYVQQGKKPNLFWVFLLAAKRMLIAIRPRNVAIVLVVWIMVVISNVTVIVGVFTRVRLPKYAAKSIMQHKEFKVLLVIVMILLFIYIINYLFTIPYCLLEGRSVHDCMRQSRILKKGKTIRTVGYFLIWNIGVALIIAIIYFAMVTIVAVLVAGLVTPTKAIAIFLMIYDRINLYVAIFAVAIGMLANMGLLSILFFEYRANTGKVKEPVLQMRLTKVPSNRRILFVVVSVIFLLDIYWIYDVARNGPTAALENFEYTQITSHRGSSYYAPENTIPAVERAIEDGADYAEVDVQLTKDGVVVLNHDFSLFRTIGIKKYIYNMTFDELRKLDAGAWFSKDFVGTTIPTLEEVLETSKGKIKLNIELKDSLKNHELEEKVVALIEDYEFERQCVITSANQKSLIKVKELNSDLRTGKIMTFSFINGMNQEGFDFYSMRALFVSEQMVSMAHRMGKEIHVWTVNDRREMNRMKQLGVDNIITDRPLIAREILYQEESSKPFIALLKIVLR